MITTASNPRFATPDHSVIDLTVAIDGEEMPFSATAADSEAHGREIFARAIAGEFGTVAEYIPPQVDLTAYAAAKRYAVETGGVTVGGVAIPSDRDTQAKLTAAFLLAQVNPQATFQWKAGAGFVTLDAASVGQIAVAIGQFVQAAYATEAAVLAAITAGTITTTAQIDAAAWPSNP